MTLTAMAGQSILYGGSGNDTLIATPHASGTENLRGGGGNDTYSFASGDGAVQVYDTAGTDSIKLGSGLLSGNLAFTDESTGTDLILTDNISSADRLDIYRQFYGSTTPDAIETLTYGDGSSINLETGGLKLTAAAGTSTLNGTAGNDTLIASVGMQLLAGGAGNDTYEYTALATAKRLSTIPAERTACSWPPMVMTARCTACSAASSSPTDGSSPWSDPASGTSSSGRT